MEQHECVRPKQLCHKKHITLKRDLGLFQATIAGVGIILGAGIYVLIGAAAGTAGNAVWLSFALASIVAVFTGLSYAELSSMFPRDAGEYVYTEKTMGHAFAFVIGYFAVLAQIITAAAVALGFGGYFSKLFTLPYPLTIALGATILFAFINYWGIKESANLNVIFTCMEAFGLLAIIGLAMKHFGKVDYFEMPLGSSGVFNAAALVFFAYIGFESIIKLSEETKNPTKTIPRAVVLSIIISTVLYILVGLAAVSILPWKELAASSAPLATAAAAIMGTKAFFLLAVIALFSTGNTILMSLIAASRSLYGMAADYGKLRAFASIDVVRRTPRNAIIISAIVTLALVLLGDIAVVAELGNLMIFFTFLAVNLAVIILRYTKPATHRPFRIPLSIGKFPLLPVIGIVSTLFMLVHLAGSVLIAGAAATALGFVIFALVRKSYSNTIK